MPAETSAFVLISNDGSLASTLMTAIGAGCTVGVVHSGGAGADALLATLDDTGGSMAVTAAAAAAGGGGGGLEWRSIVDVALSTVSLEQQERDAAEALTTLAAAAAHVELPPSPEPEPEPAQSASAAGGVVAVEQELTAAAAAAAAAAEAGSATSGWEVGATTEGVVSFWNREAGWGKIKKLQSGYLHPKRPPRGSWNREIFVHNTKLPMDAPRRWLCRGERVRFTVVLGAEGKGPQATAVVGVGEEGSVVPLLCQQQANPPTFKKGFLDKPKTKKKNRGGGLIGGKGRRK